MSATALFNRAAEILRENDRGTYTVPTKGLYPFQWNWDSCLTALGQSYLDEDRAWTEIETLFEHQWEDGMVPHIIFHQQDDGYFPGPAVWDTGRETPTSGITQPPVAAFAVRQLFERAGDKAKARQRALALLPKLARWHDWFFRCRDPQGTGLVAILHPWESGRDNSIDWDEAFERVPTDGVKPFVRRDTQHANPEHRPTQAQYERYIWLVQLFRGLGWDNTTLHDASPFQLVDPGFNGILLRSCHDLAELALELGETALAAKARAQCVKGLQAMETLWSEQRGQYLCYDRQQQVLVDSSSIAGLLAVFAPVPANRARAIATTIDRLSQQTRYLVASHTPGASGFDPLRYWRGPVWLIVNHMIADGLLNAGQTAMANRIIEDSLRLIDAGSFAEYYSPLTGEPCGGERFTWTAAMILEFLAKRPDTNSLAG